MVVSNFQRGSVTYLVCSLLCVKIHTCCVVLFLLCFFLQETEKYAHVTFFFNGGEEKAWPGEDRVMVPSPKVATYDLQPEMSASGVAKEVGKYVHVCMHVHVHVCFLFLPLVCFPHHVLCKCVYRCVYTVVYTCTCMCIVKYFCTMCMDVHTYMYICTLYMPSL